MDDADTPSLPRREKSAIVLIALLQALLLYVIEYADENSWPWFSDLAGQVCWYTLVLTVPSLMLLSLQRLDDRRFWSNTALTVLAFGATAAWAAWNASTAPGISAWAVLGPFGTTTAIAAFIALPYLQVRIARGRFTTPYPQLFAKAWQNALTIKVVGVVVGVGWLLLTLWEELFKLIGILFFSDLFSWDPFQYMVTGLLAGLGILVARTQHRAMQVARQVLFAIFTGFLPLAAFIAVIFAISLPFTGLATLRSAASTAVTLSLLMAALILLLNAVVQVGRAPPYPRPLRWLVDAAMVLLPVFAAVAVHAVTVRILSEGWTIERFWALVAVLLLLTYSAGYAFAALRPAAGWMSRLPAVNVVVSLLILGLALAANTPLLDPHRLAVASQESKIAAVAGAPSATEETRNRIEYLRFNSGRQGFQALERLVSLPHASAGFRAMIAEVREQTTHDGRAVEDISAETPAALGARVRVAAGQPAVPQTLLENLRGPGSHNLYVCVSAASPCYAQWLDVDSDDRDDVVLCMAGNGGVRCDVFAQSDNAWRRLGTLTRWDLSETELAAISEGRLQTAKPRLRELRFGTGQTFSFGDGEPAAVPPDEAP